MLSQTILMLLPYAVFSLQCQDGERQMAVGNCNAFLQCTQQVWEMKQCEGGTVFDPSSATCRPGWLQRCQSAPRNCTKPGEKMEVPGDCKTYYKCIENGQLVQESCSPLRSFDINTNTCILNNKVDCRDHMDCFTSYKYPVEGHDMKYTVCQNGKFVTKECSVGSVFDPEKNTCSSMNIVNSEMCKDGSLEPVPGDCNKYYMCKDKQRKENKCWWFQRFDPKSLKCEFFWYVHCNGNSECKGGDTAPCTNCSEYYSCNDGIWQKKVCGQELGLQLYFDAPTKECLMYNAKCFKGECSEDGIKDFFPGDCSKYRICKKGRYYVESCGWLQKFDAEKQECKYFGADCSPKDLTAVCKDNQKKPVDGSCYSYYECAQGRFEKKYCFFPLYRFDRKTSTCRFMATCDKHCVEGETTSAAGRCHQFYKCSDGIYVIQNCPSGYLYDVVKSTCVEPTQVTCASN